MTWAVGSIPYGSRVLVRGTRVELAEPALANATALRPRYMPCKSNKYRDGEHVDIKMDETIGTRDLHAIANGPIMDINYLYLPAGKLSKAEFDERERRNKNPGGASEVVA